MKENGKTRQAVEGTGGTWSCHNPLPSDPPKFSVQDPGNGWSGASIGMTPEMLMTGGGGYHPGMMMGPPAMGMYPMGGPMMMYGGPMGPMMMGGQQGPMGYQGPDTRKYAGVDLDGLECKVCGVKFTDRSQLDQHIELPSHMDKAKDIPVEDNGHPPEPEPYIPVPLTADSISSVRTKSHSIHCPYCKVWFPSITILKYYHRYEYVRGLLVVDVYCKYFRILIFFTFCQDFNISVHL